MEEEQARIAKQNNKSNNPTKSNSSFNIHETEKEFMAITTDGTMMTQNQQGQVERESGEKGDILDKRMMDIDNIHHEDDIKIESRNFNKEDQDDQDDPELAAAIAMSLEQQIAEDNHNKSSGTSTTTSTKTNKK